MRKRILNKLINIILTIICVVLAITLSDEFGRNGALLGVFVCFVFVFLMLKVDDYFSRL